MKPGEFLFTQLLPALDAVATICETHAASVAALRADYDKACLANKAPEKRAEKRTQVLLHQFDDLDTRFHSFWPKTVDIEVLHRRYRPQWPYFTEEDFKHLVESVLFLAQERFYQLAPATQGAGFDLSYFDPGHEEQKTLVRCELRRDEVPVADVRDFSEAVTAHNARGLLVSSAPLALESREFLDLFNHGARGQVLSSVAGTTFNELLKVCALIRSDWNELLESLNAEDLGDAAQVQAGIAQERQKAETILQGVNS